MFLQRAAIWYPCFRRLFSSNGARDIAGAIAELNEEMEHVFGETPANFLTGSISNKSATEREDISVGENGTSLTHISAEGEAEMVDVSHKATTYRTASASCKVILGKKAFDLVSATQIAKGDVLTVAKIAGINGAKQTSLLIPLCHNISLTRVSVDLTLDPREFSVDIRGEAATTGGTGVEMEAMTAVSVAGLTVYDMCKAASKSIRITDIQLERKTGGKSGNWLREK